MLFFRTVFHVVNVMKEICCEITSSPCFLLYGNEVSSFIFITNVLTILKKVSFFNFKSPSRIFVSCRKRLFLQFLTSFNINVKVLVDQWITHPDKNPIRPTKFLYQFSIVLGSMIAFRI